MLEYRKALNEEINELKRVLWEYGPNEWNYLTPEGVDEEFALMEKGHAQTILATYNSEIIGFAVLVDGIACPKYLNKYCSLKDLLFVGDVVVSSLHSGKGIATRLLTECLSEAKSKNVNTVLIERHEDNLASAGMMRKAGFIVIDTYYDPEKRTAGTRNSVILECKI